jgi:hypothetical protein
LQPIQACGRFPPKDCITEQEVECRVGQPVVRDSSTDPAAVVLTAPVATSLITSTTGPAHLSLTIGSGWLNNTARVFPVTLDLPIVTTGSSSQNGVFGTLSSCTPTAPRAQQTMLLGVEGGCYQVSPWFCSIMAWDPWPRPAVWRSGITGRRDRLVEWKL